MIAILNDKLAYSAFWATIISLVLQVLLILFSIGGLPPKIPIFYSMPWGESVLSAAIAIWILPILNAFFSTLDFFLISRARDDMFLSRILASLVIAVSFGCFWATYKIISLLA